MTIDKCYGRCSSSNYNFMGTMVNLLMLKIKFRLLLFSIFYFLKNFISIVILTSLNLFESNITINASQPSELK